MMKSKALILAGGLLASVRLSTEASAAAKISNGVSCTTKQKNTFKTQKNKDITDKYKCTTNPIATGSAKKKLVWVNQDCIDMNKLYIEGVADLAKLKLDTTVTATQVSTQESFIDSAKTYRSIACGKGF
jgi:hypothetical protein